MRQPVFLSDDDETSGRHDAAAVDSPYNEMGLRWLPVEAGEAHLAARRGGPTATTAVPGRRRDVDVLY